MPFTYVPYLANGQTSDTKGTEPGVRITEVSVLPSNLLNMDTTESELSVCIKEVSNSKKAGNVWRLTWIDYMARLTMNSYASQQEPSHWSARSPRLRYYVFLNYVVSCIWYNGLPILHLLEGVNWLVTAENIHVHLMSLNLIIEKYNKWCRNISRSCSCGWLSDKTTRRAQFCTQAWSRIMKDYGEKIGYTRGEYMGVPPPLLTPTRLRYKMLHLNL